MAAIVDSDVVNRLARVPLMARWAMLGQVSGRHQSPHRGSSVEFAEYRKYVVGDDMRRVDWRVYGRTDRFYIKEFEADTNLRCCLILDASGSMGYGSVDETKWSYGKKLALTLAYLALQQGDAVGLYAGDTELSVSIPPSRRPTHLSVLHESLSAIVPGKQTSLENYLHHLAEEIPKRALVILISDLFDDPGKVIECWRHLRFREHDLAVFHLLDPQELTLPFERAYRFEDMEGDEAVLADPNDLKIRYHEAVTRYQQRLAEGVAQCQVDYQEVLIHDDYEQVLARFLDRRAGNGR